MGLRTRTARRGLAALLAIATVGLLALGGSSLATASPHAAVAQDAPKVSKRAFHDGMRRLWVDHVTWTRLFIVSFVADLPDQQATTDRLLENQVDIGQAIKPFYGKAAGNQLTDLLTQHILTAAQLLGEAGAVAERIASRSLPVAYAAKQALRASQETSAAEGLRLERTLFASLFALEDQKEGMAAFAEKRAPEFRHR